MDAPCAVIVAALALGLAASVWKVFYLILWRPLSIQKSLAAQGILGPRYRILVGSVPEYVAIAREARASPLPHMERNIMPRVMPHYIKWGKQYGVPFIFWLGYKCRITVSDPELCKEILFNKSGLYTKPRMRPDLQDLLADGLATLDGEKWAQHRRIVSPAFFIEKLRSMAPTISRLADDMLFKWQLNEAGACKEFDVSTEFRTLTADIIAHTAFGSSYAEGKQVFMLQYEQQKLFEKLTRTIYIPGSRFLPNAVNRRRWALKKEITSLLREMIVNRLSTNGSGGKDDPYGTDLLGLMMAAYKQESQGSQRGLKMMSMQDIIDECKTFFFAGHDTTSSLLMWSTMLLAAHPEWQEQARDEVLGQFGTSHPTAEGLNTLKTVGMVLNETLRLYPPAISIFREASTDAKLGNTVIPQGTTLMIPILAMHLEPKYWGPNAHCFNPQRFADGVLRACSHPMAFLPFSSGPRNCVGLNFAMLEAKIVLCRVLQHLRFRLSPGFKHEPCSILTLQSEHGVHIVYERI